MANTILTAEVLVKDTLEHLYDAIKVMGLVNRAYEGEFTSGVKKGTQIKVKRPVDFNAYEYVNDIVIQNIEETALYVTVDKHFDVSFAVDTGDWTFSIEDFANKYLKPAAKALALKMESYLIEEMILGTQDYIADVNGAPSSVDDLAAINQKAEEMNIPDGERVALVTTATKRTMLGTINQLFEADKRADNGSTFRTADIGIAYDVAYYSSNALEKVGKTFTNGTYTTGATVLNDVDKYASSVILTGGLEGETITKGTLLKAGDVTFKAAADAVFAANGNVTVEVVIVSGAIEAGAEVERVATGKNFLFHPSAVSFIAVAPALPMGGDMKAIAKDEESNLSIRMVVDYAIRGKSDTISLDIYGGAKVVDERLIAQF